MIDQCVFPRCRNLSYLGYIGCEICVVHWNQLCGSDCKTEKRLLKKIGLERNEKGQVSPITIKEK